MGKKPATPRENGRFCNKSKVETTAEKQNDVSAPSPKRKRASASNPAKTNKEKVESEVIQKQIEDQVLQLKSDKMKDLIERYFLNLPEVDRNGFLVSLMRLANFTSE